METSSADSTTLRIRSSLQRTGISHTKQQGGQGLFEELLKLPAQSMTTQRAATCDSCEPEEPVADQMAPSTEPSAPTNDTDDAADEAASKDEELVAESNNAANCMLAVCPQTPIPVEVEPEPVADTEVTSELTPIAVDDNQAPVEVTQPVVNETTESAPIEVVDATPAVVEQSQTPTIESTSSGSNLDNQRKPETFKFKEANGATRRTSERPTETHETVQPVDRSRDTFQVQGKPDVKPHSDAAPQAAPGDDQPAGAERVERHERGEQREKWYEAKDTDAITTQADNANAQDSAGQQSQAGDDLQIVAGDAKDQQSAAGAFDLSALGFDLSANAQAISPSADALSAMAAAMATSGTSAQGWNSTSSSGSGSSASGQSSAIEASGSRASGFSGAAANNTNHVSGSASTVSISGASNANGTSAGSATQAGESSDVDPGVRQLTQQERVRLVQRVARSFSRLGPEGGQVTLKLHPPQLGVLNVSIRLEGQTMSAKLQTESSAAREVILENLPQLRDRLAEQGIEVEKFQVDVASSSDMNAGGQTSNSNDNSSSSSGDGSSGAASIDYRRASRIAADRAQRVNLGSIPNLNHPALSDRSLDLHV